MGAMPLNSGKGSVIWACRLQRGIMVTMTSRYQPTGYCPECGYPMDAGRCPECGKHVEKPAKRDPRTRRTRLRRIATRTLLVVLAVAGLSYAGRYAVYAWWPTEHLRELEASKNKLASFAKRVIRWRWEREHEQTDARRRAIEAELN